MQASSEIQWEVVHENYPVTRQREDQQPDTELVGTRRLTKPCQPA